MAEDTQKKLSFSLGIFDEISDRIKEKIAEESNKCETYGVGVYTDKFVIDNFMTYPSKNLEKRISMVRNINGVDFTFAVDTSNSSEVKKIIENAYAEYLQNKQ